MKDYFKINSWILAILVLFLIVGCAGSKFKRAKEINTIKTYDRFLGKYGDSKYGPKAKELREKLLFENVKHDGIIISYGTYLKEYPEGKYVSEVKKFKEDAWFEKAKTENTVSGYHNYLKEYPEGKYVLKIQEILPRVRYEKASKSLPSLTNYIKKQKDSPFADEAKKKKDKWKNEIKRSLTELNNIAKTGKVLIKLRYGSSYQELSLIKLGFISSRLTMQINSSDSSELTLSDVENIEVTVSNTTFNEIHIFTYEICIKMNREENKFINVISLGRTSLESKITLYVDNEELGDKVAVHLRKLFSIYKS